MAILAFDIGGTAVKYGLWEDETVTESGSFPTPATWEEMKNSLLIVKRQFESDYGLKGIAFSAPGAVDTTTGIIGGISALDYIHHFPIVAELEELLGLPVSMENDANCAALAEVHYGAAKAVNNCYFMVIGSGIGGALVINRQLIKGKHLFGGELGYMLLNKEDTLSKLGSPVVMTKTFQQKHQNLVTTEEIFDLAAVGDQEALEAIDGFYKGLAQGLHNILVTIDPDCIVLGGGISQRSDLLSRIQKEVEILLKQTHADDIQPDIRICQYRNQANLIGAVAHFEQSQAG
ncbi:ROK family protein [Streptococcus moroccensis]|uniref:NBD/HSP70 family sugar kinase n=1 Tax=Streptococcus moroccensis TaxID=1451356 RepID=A0ABT9YS33_9STRE|nr:ROK family protein [Streptococcus moroccensis]MDQ0222809.1 putative NBD/HSP70 family sugar kinase [Streptococcus moroccensis]